MYFFVASFLQFPPETYSTPIPPTPFLLQSPSPMSDMQTITARDVEMDAILDRVKNVSLGTRSGGGVDGGGVIPGPTDVTVWVNDVQYLLPSHLLGDGARVSDIGLAVMPRVLGQKLDRLACTIYDAHSYIDRMSLID